MANIENRLQKLEERRRVSVPDRKPLLVLAMAGEGDAAALRRVMKREGLKKPPKFVIYIRGVRPKGKRDAQY